MLHEPLPQLVGGGEAGLGVVSQYLHRGNGYGLREKFSTYAKTIRWGPGRTSMIQLKDS